VNPAGTVSLLQGASYQITGTVTFLDGVDPLLPSPQRLPLRPAKSVCVDFSAAVSSRGDVF